MLGKAARSRRGAAHLVDFLLRLYMRIDGAVSGGGGRLLRMAWLREDMGQREKRTSEMVAGDSEADR